MHKNSQWLIANVELARVVPLAIATASIAFATPVQAAGTVAGTTISNTATATYDDPSGTPTTLPSNRVDILVDEVLDVTVVSADPGNVIVAPGSTDQAVSFTVTNTGNGSEAFRLTPTTAIGGDQFDPTTTSIVLDTNNNGIYDPTIDTVYVPGSNDPVLAPDASVTVFVLSTIPGGTIDLNRGFLDLTAAATTGTGDPGTVFARQGQGGGDAIVGTTRADGVDRGTYLVQTATVSFVKSATIVDPFGGGKSVPGSIVTYTLVANVSGTGTLTNLKLGDAVPTNTTYEAGTITLQSATLTDGVDADAGEIASNTVAVRLGDVAGGQTRTVTFKVKIN
jgi:uncharacterized repeat protein (TIGR01451 family)